MNNNLPCSKNYNNSCCPNSPCQKEKTKFNFKSIKNNTISSLNDVEFFLNKLQHTIRYIKLYKLLK